MPFIGIITNSKNEEYMLKLLSKYIPTENTIFITDKNIANMKNIRFETIVINSNLSDFRNLKVILSNAKELILNADLQINLNVLEDLDLSIITYGFNNKATFAVSSVSENSVIVCLQRVIKNINSEKYEPQEFEMEKVQNIDVYTIIIIQIIMLLYQKRGKNEEK